MFNIHLRYHICCSKAVGLTSVHGHVIRNEFKDEGLGFRVYGLVYRLQGFRLHIFGLSFRVSALGFRV